ncbi:MAG TPA: type 1 glutamine amidotransferase [Streptosporangiaceae bacterium]|nr:type 1 glutamine amidotransferase [Streptosporangiaceae bacterium]
MAETLCNAARDLPGKVINVISTSLAQPGSPGYPRAPDRPPSTVLVLQHAAWESAGTYADMLAECGAQVRTVRLDLHNPLPDWQDFDAFVVMGGPMSVNDEEHYPWLREEKRLLADAVAAARPVFATCLGAQLLAAALGGRVSPGAAAEIGLDTVRLSPASFTDPLLGGLPRELPVFQWHGEAFDLPPGATGLAQSPLCQYQAMRVGPYSYGFQFHLEVTADDVRGWARVPQCVSEAERVLGAGALDALVADMTRCERKLERYARRTFGRWLELITTASAVVPGEGFEPP